MVNLKDVLQQKVQTAGKTLFIAVDGHSGSGKSTLAKWLGDKLPAEIIHTDDFSGWENPLNWWPDVIREVFEPVRAGATTLSYQPASWWEDHHPEVVENQPVTPIMILEGVSSSRTEFNEYLSLRIFVDTPKEVCLMRGIERDTSSNSNVVEVKKMWEDWFAEEVAFFTSDDPKVKADIVIDGTKPFEEQLAL